MIWNRETCYPELFGDFSCIYVLKNKVNGRMYIGKAENYTKRLSAHYYTLKKGSHPNKEMQIDFDAGHDFEVEILCIFHHDYATRSKEKALETFFIIQNKAVENGYNKSYNFNNRSCAIETVLANAEYICKELQCGIEDVVEIKL